MNTKSNLGMLVIVPLVAIFMMPTSVNANDSFGSWGGSWGASSGLFGSRGGPIRNLLAAAPVRTTLARVANQLAGFGSYGGSYGSRGNLGGSLGGYRSLGWGSGGSRGSWSGRSWGGSGGFSSYSGGSTGRSWGSSSGYASSSYVGSGFSDSGYSSSVLSSPSYVSTPSYLSPPSYASAPAVSTSIPYSSGCATCNSYPSFASGIASPLPTSFGAPFASDFGTPIGTGFGIGTSFGSDSGFISEPSFLNETGLINETGFPTDGGFSGGPIIEPYYDSQGGDPFQQGGSVLGPNDGSGFPLNPIQGGGQFGTPPTEPGGAEPTPGSDDFTLRRKRLQKSTIEVRLPSEAKVYVNGKLTKSSGDLRSFVSRNQKAGSKYRYEIAAVLNGQRKVKEFTMRAGGTKAIDFDFSALTTVALQVPDDAKVVLAGNATNGSGKARKFETKRLTEGEKWDGYTVKVTVVRDGKEVVRKRTIDVVGGQTYALKFDFDQVDSTAVATNK